ncbi:TonB-dependent receptor [Draconibacterium sediminis]|uniref:SusC/RagA family TonB-linked outer membrane protein n=1 Tax=Draconibacterium sediminis TaxID=1544798 RepID=UPI0026EE76DF|nr:TonB-dependent receptor [Draconibacterium sediminis]
MKKKKRSLPGSNYRNLSNYLTIIFITVLLVSRTSAVIGAKTTNSTTRTSSTFQQEHVVKGKVSDQTGAPLPGVTIIIKGTNQGTVSDSNGEFGLDDVSPDATLQFSFIGMKLQEHKVGDKTFFEVIMEADAIGLEEVVAVGYGTMKKGDLSGASVSMGEQDIKASVITNLDQALQGRASGVTSMATSGAPGSSVSIRVRGQSTINSNAEPLYVVDGVILQGGGTSGSDWGLGDKLGNGSVSSISPLSTINPSDILSVEILKDASATAIYGAQGSNGVILITTKRGKTGEAKFTYEGMIGVQDQRTRLEMMNLREFAEYSNSVAMENNALESRNEFLDPSLLGAGTNWQDAIFQEAFMQQHQVSASGGTDAIRYYVSGSYMNQEGTIIGSNFERYSVRTNLDAQLKPWLKLGLTINYANTNEDLGLAEGTEGVVNYSLLTPPDIPIYDIEGNYASVIREGYTRVNPIANTLDKDLTLQREKLNGNIFMDISPLKNLTWHTELGYDINSSKGEYFLPVVTYGNWTRSINENSIRRNNGTFYQLKNYLTYDNKVGMHNYTLMAGQDAWLSSWEYMSIYATGLPDNEIHNPALGNDPVIGHAFNKTSMSSFFGRGTYNYNDKYYGTYTYRRDGSSNFGPKNRWASFHAFAVSWRFTNEKFLEWMKPVITNGKIRFGWGQTGNSNIGGYLWGASISRMPTSLGMGYRQSNIANPYIQWETQEQLNLGLDLGLINDRINLTVDVYDKNSADMLMDLQLPSYMGTRGNESSALAPPKGNYGEINNKGIEISMFSRNLTGEFQWDTKFQISANRNKLVALDGTDNAHIEGYGQWSDVVTVTNVGESLYNFYGYKVAGVYTDLEDIENSPKTDKYPSDGVFNRYNTVWVGDLKFEDISGPDGVKDGIIDAYDRTNIGSPMPKFTYGLENTFRYKNFDLTVFVNGTYGNKILNYTAINLSNMKSIWDNQLDKVTQRAILEPINGDKVYDQSNGISSWYDDITNVQVTNPDTKVPRAIANDPNDNDRISDRYIEDGSYLRIKNITLGYTVPTAITNRYHLENLRIYMNIQNLYTFTKYTGYDPEIGVSTVNQNVYGLDNGKYPIPRIVSLGLNVSF